LRAGGPDAKAVIVFIKEYFVMFGHRSLCLFMFVFGGLVRMAAQQPAALQVATLRTEPAALWRRVSPTAQQPGGPVLYQIMGRSSATANHIPKVSNGQLVNSLLTDNGSGVTIGSLAIDHSGIITNWNNLQTFPGVVSSVRAGDASIAIGIGAAGSALNVSVASNGITNVNIADGALERGKIAGIAAVLDAPNFFLRDQFLRGLVIEISGGFGIVLGGAGCQTAHFVAVDAGGSGGPCHTYALGSEGINTYVNVQASSGSGFISFRAGGNAPGAEQMFIDPNGVVTIKQTVHKSGGSFKIDHPLDPANKYLYHSFVESPDMKNIYDGVVTLDGSGEAFIALPDWFGALNRDFRYKLTAIGAPEPNLYIAEEITNNHFKIAGGAPGAEVSWQVTGIRQDAYANAHRIPLEQDKPAVEKGTYLHPELFAAPQEEGFSALSGPKSHAGK
jgi:hypothetical protein